jgi:hypothetical protein
MRSSRTSIVHVGLAGILALVAGACGPQAEVTVDTHADALTSIADSFAQSWAWEGRLDLDIAEQDLQGVDEYERTLLRQWEDAADARAIGALGDDGSWRTAFVDGDTTYLDVRLGVGELLQAETLEPDTSVYLRLDIPYVLREWALMVGASTPEQLSRNVSEWLGGSPFEAVALAIAEGGWGGVTGPLDLAGMGVTDDDLEEARREFREEVIGVADRETMLELLDEAVTLRDFTRADDGGSVAVLDVHPRDAAFAVYDLFDDAEHLAAGHTPPEELPRTLEGVATVTFDRAGMVTEVATDVLAIARELHAHDPASGADELAAFSEESTFAVMFSFSEHGQVPTVLDLPDAVTTSWGELAEAFASLWHSPVVDGLHDEVIVEESVGVEAEASPPPDDDRVEAPDDTTAPEPGTAPSTNSGALSEVEEVEMTVASAAFAMARHRDQHGAYSPAALDGDWDRPPFPDVEVTVVWVDEEDFCLHGDHAAIDVSPVLLRTVHDQLTSMGQRTCQDLADRPS